MKKIYLLIALGACIAVCGSCSKDMPEKTVSDGWQNMVIEASQEGPSSKTSVDGETGFVYWNPGDAINVFNGEIGLKFVSQNYAKAKVASFVNSYSVIIGSNEGENIVGDGLFGLYPYDPNATSDGVSVSTTLPDSQMAVAGTFADNLFITLGKTEGTKPEMGFYNVCGGIRFKVSEEGIRAIRLKGNNGEFLAGKAKIKFDEFGCPTVSEVVDGKSEVSLECPDGFVPGEWYYLVTLPVALNQGYTVTFLKGSDGADFVSDSSTEIKRSVFASLEQKDEGLEWSFRELYIPDANFKAYCLSNFDTDGDGKLSLDELETVTEITVDTEEIASMEGLELFKNLEYLECVGWVFYDQTGSFVPSGRLEKLDVSKNTNLIYLYCGFNQLSSLDISKNINLEYLYCECNQLSSLDISKNINLIYLGCSTNQLTELDISKNEKLKDIDVMENRLSSLDVSNNTALTDMRCSYNQISSLDLSHNTKLTSLECDYNSLDCVDISNNPILWSLSCSGNRLTGFDVSKYVNLKSLRCADCQLTSLDVSKNTALRTLYCYDNPLTSLDVSSNTALSDLMCYDTQLTSLDVSNNTALRLLSCQKNPNLTELWLGMGQTIQYLSYDSNVTEIKYKSE